MDSDELVPMPVSLLGIYLSNQAAIQDLEITVTEDAQALLDLQPR